MDQQLIDRNKLLEDMFPFGRKDPADVYRIITDQPIIETQRTGYWIPVGSYEACGGDYEAWMAHGNPVAFHYCSECKEEPYVDENGNEILSKFCPFCGAKMFEEEIDSYVED